MVVADYVANFGEISLASLAIPGASIAVSDSIPLRSVQYGPAALWLVINCTQTVVATGAAACRFALSSATADDAASLVNGYDLWIYGNMDFAGIFPKGVPYQSMVAGAPLFHVPVAPSPLLSTAHTSLALTIMQVSSGAAITAGKVKALLTTTPPTHSELIFPNGI